MFFQQIDFIILDTPGRQVSAKCRTAGQLQSIFQPLAPQGKLGTKNGQGEFLWSRRTSVPTWFWNFEDVEDVDTWIQLGEVFKYLKLEYDLGDLIDI